MAAARGRDEVTPASWEEVASLQDLAQPQPLRAIKNGHPILLVRAGEDVFAVGNLCTHQGAPLDKGVVKIAGSVRTVTCPAHGSMFRLDDGKVMRPPATKPVPVYDVKVEGGRILVRLRE
jgi:nitrite reductase/ring-hydroxylating ferredoxin subunit